MLARQASFASESGDANSSSYSEETDLSVSCTAFSCSTEKQQGLDQAHLITRMKTITEASKENGEALARKYELQNLLREQYDKWHDNERNCERRDLPYFLTIAIYLALYVFLLIFGARYYNTHKDFRAAISTSTVGMCSIVGSVQSYYCALKARRENLKKIWGLPGRGELGGEPREDFDMMQCCKGCCTSLPEPCGCGDEPKDKEGKALTTTWCSCCGKEKAPTFKNAGQKGAVQSCFKTTTDEYGWQRVGFFGKVRRTLFETKVLTLLCAGVKFGMAITGLIEDAEAAKGIKDDTADLLNSTTSSLDIKEGLANITKLHNYGEYGEPMRDDFRVPFLGLFATLLFLPFFHFFFLSCYIFLVETRQVKARKWVNRIVLQWIRKKKDPLEAEAKAKGLKEVDYTKIDYQDGWEQEKTAAMEKLDKSKYESIRGLVKDNLPDVVKCEISTPKFDAQLFKDHIEKEEVAEKSVNASTKATVIGQQFAIYKELFSLFFVVLGVTLSFAEGEDKQAAKIIGLVIALVGNDIAFSITDTFSKCYSWKLNDREADEEQAEIIIERQKSRAATITVDTPRVDDPAVSKPNSATAATAPLLLNDDVKRDLNDEVKRDPSLLPQAGPSILRGGSEPLKSAKPSPVQRSGSSFSL